MYEIRDSCQSFSKRAISLLRSISKNQDGRPAALWVRGAFGLLVSACARWGFGRRSAGLPLGLLASTPIGLIRSLSGFFFVVLHLERSCSHARRLDLRLRENSVGIGSRKSGNLPETAIKRNTMRKNP